MPQISCFHCGSTWFFEPPLGRSSDCSNCGRSARVCRNCQYFDLNSNRSCRESQAEWVKSKEEANFCGYFQAKEQQVVQEQKDELNRTKLESLFSSAEPATTKSKSLSSSKSLSIEDQFADFIKNKNKK